MPTLLHDPAVCDSIRDRVATLRPDSVRRWGKMSVDQMLWHLNQGLGQALGDVPVNQVKGPLPIPLMKLMVFNLPWPKGAPTAPEFVPGQQRYDFESERARCVTLIDRFVRKSVDDQTWALSPFLNHLTGREWSRLTAKHLDHHLRQFSA